MKVLIEFISFECPSIQVGDEYHFSWVRGNRIFDTNKKVLESLEHGKTCFHEAGSQCIDILSKVETTASFYFEGNEI